MPIRSIKLSKVDIYDKIQTLALIFKMSLILKIMVVWGAVVVAFF